MWCFFPESVLCFLEFAIIFVRDSALDDGCVYVVDRAGEGNGAVVANGVAVAFVLEYENNPSPELVLGDRFFIPPCVQNFPDLFPDSNPTLF